LAAFRERCDARPLYSQETSIVVCLCVWLKLAISRLFEPDSGALSRLLRNELDSLAFQGLLKLPQSVCGASHSSCGLEPTYLSQRNGRHSQSSVACAFA